LPPIQAEAVQVAALAYAAAGRPDRARAMLAVWDKLHADFRQPNLGTRQAMVAEIAIAEKRYADAVAAWRKGDVGTCVHCAPVGLGIAHDLMGQADSAIANFERYITLPVIDRGPVDQFYLAGAHKRLGELYEAKGEKSKALSHYLTFVELWKNADPELQPRVAEVRAAIRRVRDTEGAR
jgi:tetratricopeptide (TPR) repeat protein